MASSGAHNTSLIYFLQLKKSRTEDDLAVEGGELDVVPSCHPPINFQLRQQLVSSYVQALLNNDSNAATLLETEMQKESMLAVKVSNSIPIMHPSEDHSC